MSSVSFENVLRRAPELGRTTDVLRRWIESHQERRFLDPISLYRDLGSSVTPQSLIRVLADLVETGQLEMKYRVLLPDGTLSEEEFCSPEEVPPTVFDSAFNPVEVSDERIVTIYQLPDSGHHE